MGLFWRVQMVVKTETCAFSGQKVFPGRGVRYVRIDARTFIFGSGKAEASFHMKRNQRKISWTMFYRRLHKKGLSEDVSKKRTVKRAKIQRAYVGASLDVIKAKKSQKPEQRAAARDAAIREIKAAKKAKQDEKKKAAAAAKGKSAPKAAPAAKSKGGKR